MYPDGTKLMFAYELLSSMKSGELVGIHFENEYSSEIIKGEKENCRCVVIDEKYRMTHNMFRSYCTRIANEQGMVIKTKTSESKKFMYIWRVL